MTRIVSPYPPGNDDGEPYAAADMPDGPSPEIQALRAQPTRIGGEITPSSAPGPLCVGCPWLISRGRLAGDCRKLAITSTVWGAIAGMPGNAAATAFQLRADEEAADAAAYRGVPAPTCAPRSARVVAR